MAETLYILGIFFISAVFVTFDVSNYVVILIKSSQINYSFCEEKQKVIFNFQRTYFI